MNQAQNCNGKQRPDGPIVVQKTLLRDITPYPNAAFDFEKVAHIVEIVLAEGQRYVRRIKYCCSAGANGRPEYHLDMTYYGADHMDADCLTADNWRGLLPEPPVYQFDGWDIGVLY